MDEKDWLWLCSIPKLYRKQKMVLLQYFGSAREIRMAGKEEWKSWEKLGAKWVSQLYPAFADGYMDHVLKQMQQHDIRFFSCEHPDYPDRLRQIADYPYGLFVRGALPENSLTAAVVGSRSCSAYGAGIARAIGRMLAGLGIPLISGMALGIDGISQKAALEAGGKSYAVLGNGPDKCYPYEHEKLYETLCVRGGILSEFPCGTPGLKMHFPMRNRIISGLSDLVIVVEARKRSGSLITADCALEQGRDVLAVPGRCQDVLSEGCNRLIHQGAGIIVSAEELGEEIRERFPAYFQGKKDPGGSKKKKQLVLAQDEELVYSYLDLLPIGLEGLRNCTGLDESRLMRAVLNLQLMDLAVEIGKNQYVRVA